MNKKLQEKKKKLKERETKKKVEARRVQIRKAAKEKYDIDLANKKATKQKPIVVDIDKHNKKITDRIEYNLKILEALEAEYKKEKEKSKELSQQLESEGHLTLEEKLAAVKDRIESVTKEKIATESEENLTK